MKQTIWMPLICLACLHSNAQLKTPADSVKHLLDTTISIMKQKAYRADKVSWNALQQELLQKTAKVNSVTEAGFAFTRLFDELNDVHGAFFYKDTFFRASSKPKNAERINAATLDELKKGPRIISRMLKGNIAYLNIPFINVQDTVKVIMMANRINDSLVALLRKDPKGLLIDLRLNQGGNVFPMIAGLHSLFNDGAVGSDYSFEFKDKTGTISFYKDSLICDYYRIPISSPSKHTNIPVAVLIGPSTASAAEGTAAALTFRKKTILVGEESMGLTTANDGFLLMPGIGFNLAVGVIKDGKGKRLEEGITPDINVSDGDNFLNLEADKKVQAAIDWLLKQK